MKDSLRNQVEDIIRQYFGSDIENLGPYHNGVENMALEILRLRKDSNELSWIKSPDRMGS